MLCEHEVAGLIAGASGKVYVLYCSRYRFCFVFGSGLQLHYYAATVEGARGQRQAGHPMGAIECYHVVFRLGRAGRGRGLPPLRPPPRARGENGFHTFTVL